MELLYFRKIHMKASKSLVPFFIVYVIIILALLSLVWILGQYLSSMWWYWVFVLCVIIFWAVVWIINYIDISGDVLYMRDKELVYNEQQGLFSINKQHIQNDDIDFIDGKQGFRQRLINIWDIIIHTTKKEIVITNIKWYSEVLDILQDTNT